MILKLLLIKFHYKKKVAVSIATYKSLVLLTFIFHYRAENVLAFNNVMFS